MTLLIPQQTQIRTHLLSPQLIEPSYYHLRCPYRLEERNERKVGVMLALEIVITRSSVLQLCPVWHAS